MNTYIKILFLFILLLLEGCSSKMKPYPYDQPYKGNPCMFTDTENYQRCLNNSDFNPSMTGKY